MHLSRFLLVGALALAVGACDDDAGTAPEMGPLAALRFVNAVPDTVTQDLRLVDVTWDAFLNVAFGASYPATAYFPVPAGSQRIKVFVSGAVSSDPTIVSRVFVDTVLSLQEGSNYSMVHVGRATTGPGRQAIVTEDVFDAPPAGQFAVRVVHVAASTGAVDLYARPSGTAPLGTPIATNVAYLSATPYVVLDTGAVNLAVTATGLATVAANSTAPVGAVATTTASGIGGSRIEGSVLTAYIIPGATPTTAPTILWIVDRRPPILSGP
ncbi:MAG: DUF4397 domain-containing protein [Gemmatimonadota bacterium]|nr:DUF4397 domain-containing protein [Gemmatimonadota bacterium]